MRLDLFLKISRLVKRRTLAQEFCNRGWIEVNGLKAKAAKNVTKGDRITLLLGSRKRDLEILQIPQQRGVPAKDANKLYRIIADQPKIEGGD